MLSFPMPLRVQPQLISNASESSTAAVNTLLSSGKKVGMITEGEYKGDFICSYEDWQSVSADHILTGTGVKDPGFTAYVIEKTPTVYISGTKEALTPSPDGYVYNTLVTVSSDYNNERIAMGLMGFGTTEDVSAADAVVGGYGLDEESLAAVQTGVPYVGFTQNAVEIVQESLLPGIQLPIPRKLLSTQVISWTGTTYSTPSVRTTLRLCPKVLRSLCSVTAAALLWKAYFTVMMRARTLS